MSGAGSGTLTALILAGSREGAADPMAVSAGVSHKALLPAGGVPMLLRVIRTLQACPEVGRIVVSAQDCDALLAPFKAARPVLPRSAAASPSRSVAAVLEEFGVPLLVTTADHALLTPEIVAGFLRAADPGADACAAVVRSTVVQAAYPATRRTWLRFRDGSFSGANLFLLRTPRAARAVQLWQRVEQQRKHPLAMARAVGPLALLCHASGLVTRRGMLRLLERRVGARLAIIELQIAEAAIDVDCPGDLALVEAVLARHAAA